MVTRRSGADVAPSALFYALLPAYAKPNHAMLVYLNFIRRASTAKGNHHTWQTSTHRSLSAMG